MITRMKREGVYQGNKSIKFTGSWVNFPTTIAVDGGLLVVETFNLVWSYLSTPFSLAYTPCSLCSGVFDNHGGCRHRSTTTNFLVYFAPLCHSRSLYEISNGYTLLNLYKTYNLVYHWNNLLWLGMILVQVLEPPLCGCYALVS